MFQTFLTIGSYGSWKSKTALSQTNEEMKWKGIWSTDMFIYTLLLDTCVSVIQVNIISYLRLCWRFYANASLISLPPGVSCIWVPVWVWAWAAWPPGSPSASWATRGCEAPPSSPGFSSAWSWSWSSPRCWGFTASSWPSFYLQNKCVHQTPSHSFHIKAARTNRRFSPTSIKNPLRGSDRMGWQQKHVGGQLWHPSPSVDVIYPYCLKPSSRVRSCVYRTGMKMYWLLWDVWTVCLSCCLILTCTVTQSPSTSCKCSNQSVQWVWVSTFTPLCPIPHLLILCFYVSGFDCHSLFSDCWEVLHISVLFFHVLFGDHFWITVTKSCKVFFFFFHYLWRAMKILT